MKQQPHLIALDLDGSLLTDQKTIGWTTRRYLKKLERQGHIIVIATGRPLRAIIPYYEQINLTGPIIAYNGACVINPQQSEFKPICFSFDKDIIKGIFQSLGPQYIKNAMCETNQKIWVLNENNDFSGIFWHQGMDVIIGDFEQTLTENPMTIIVKSIPWTEEVMDAFKNAISKYQNLAIRFWSFAPYAEIYFNHISKGHAILDLANFYHIPQQRILAFGDSDNDIEMLQIAGTSFALKNGTDEAKQNADIITKYSNNQQGIYRCLKRYFRKL